jgi:hypothetical protein
LLDTVTLVRTPLLILLLLVALAAPTAQADGDPASDYLVVQNVFLGVELPQPAAVAALNASVAAVYARGYRIRVAVVATPTDLGSIPSLFGRPTQYAKFLGSELRGYYIGPLLIVMPSGFGIYDGGRSVAAETAVLARRPSPGTTRDQLALAAAAAVDDLRLAGALASKDVLAPAAAAVSSSGTAGHSMKLEYTVFDDSGKSAVMLEVLVGQTRLATIDVPLARVSAHKTYSVPWLVPATIPAGQARLCVTARDAAGNLSRRYCTPIDL